MSKHIQQTEHKALQEFALKVKKEVGVFSGLARSALDHAHKAGAILYQAKTYIQKNTALDFRKWVVAEVGISDRHAENYIKVFTHWKTLEKALADNPALNLTGALDLLKGPPRRRKAKATPILKFADGRSSKGMSTTHIPLAEELEAIAQRLAEIVQDDKGRIDLAKVDRKRLENAVLAIDDAATNLRAWVIYARQAV